MGWNLGLVAVALGDCGDGEVFGVSVCGRCVGLVGWCAFGMGCVVIIGAMVGVVLGPMCVELCFVSETHPHYHNTAIRRRSERQRVSNPTGPREARNAYEAAVLRQDAEEAKK